MFSNPSKRSAHLVYSLLFLHLSTLAFACITWGQFGVGKWPCGNWRPYADTSPFNRRIPPNPPLLKNSAGIIPYYLARGAPNELVVGYQEQYDWNHPVYYPTSTDPLYTIHCFQPWGQCGTEGYQVRIPKGAIPAGGTDKHLTVIDQESGWEYDFWDSNTPSGSGGTLDIGWGGRTLVNGTGIRSAGTQSGFGNLAGIIRGEEMEYGTIPHALFMVLYCSGPHAVYPSIETSTLCLGDLTNTAPYGARFWLNMTDDEISALPGPKYQKIILTAMAHYGLLFGDTGGGEDVGFSVQPQSQATYTSFGFEDEMITYAKSAGIKPNSGVYRFDFNQGVDWAGKLHVVDPCVSQGNC